MSAAPVSRSSALPEITLQSRRAPQRSEPEQAFTLPQEPAERPRARLDDDRNASREGAETSEPSKSEGGRGTSAADSDPQARVGDAGKGRKAADAKEPSDKAKTQPATDQAPATDTVAADGKTVEAAAGDQPAKGKTAEESKAAPAPALDGAPMVADGRPETPVVAVATPQAVPVPAVAAEFLALAALTVQVGEQTRLEGVATPEGKPEGQVAAASPVTSTAPQTAANAVVVPVPGTPVKVDGQASAEAAAAGIKAGSTPQLVAAEGKAKKAEPAAAAIQQGEAKPADAQAELKDATEPGKPAVPPAAGEVKTTEAAPASQPAPQAGPADSAAPAAGAQQATTPVSPQALLAAGPQSLTTPQAPPTELDAAAQATAHAQAEAAHKTLVGESGRATPLHVVPVEIGARALAGNKRFDIRLDPAELGRIDVSLEISDKGEVSAKLTVDRVETLHMLQRDARTLERAFEQAGLKPSEGGIDMSLRDSGDQQAGARQQRQDDETPRGRRAWVQATDDSGLVTEVASLPRNAGRLGGVDLSI